MSSFRLKEEGTGSTHIASPAEWKGVGKRIRESLPEEVVRRVKAIKCLDDHLGSWVVPRAASLREAVFLLLEDKSCSTPITTT